MCSVVKGASSQLCEAVANFFARESHITMMPLETFLARRRIALKMTPTMFSVVIRWTSQDLIRLRKKTGKQLPTAKKEVILEHLNKHK